MTTISAIYEQDRLLSIQTLIKMPHADSFAEMSREIYLIKL